MYLWMTVTWTLFLTLKLMKILRMIPLFLYQILLITDENNNLLYCFDNITYEEFCRDQSLPKDNLFDKNYTSNGFSIELLEHTDEDLNLFAKCIPLIIQKAKTFC